MMAIAGLAGDPYSDYSATELQAGALGKMARMPTLQERLDLAVRQAEEQLALVREAREILQRNPDLEKLLDLLQKARF